MRMAIKQQPLKEHKRETQQKHNGFWRWRMDGKEYTRRVTEGREDEHTREHKAQSKCGQRAQKHFVGDVLFCQEMKRNCAQAE